MSPPAGPHLLSGFGDISGFAHEDLTRSPREQFTHPVFSNTDEIDYAGLKPSVVVRSGTPAPRSVPGAPTLAYSLDYGRSWKPLQPRGMLQPQDTTSAITVSADGRSFVVAARVPLVTLDRGWSWTAARGLPTGSHPIADKVAPETFYAVDFTRSELYVSTDGGRTFRRRAARGLPASLQDDVPNSPERQWPLIATPGDRGDLWLVAPEGLFHSTDAGRVFSRIDGGIFVTALGFGKAPPGRTYPALYALGVKDKTYAMWRSDDEGNSWIRINDTDHRYGQRFRCIAGDPRVYGRVYVGTDGRGIVYGEPRAR